MALVGHDLVMPQEPSLKYAHVESERRYLINGLPPGWSHERAHVIRDRYILGTRLRLREVEAPGEPTTWKLGQKIRFDPSSPERVAHTTLYLDADEASTLARLPANELVKARRTRTYDGQLWAVDEFLGVLAGLFLAELDLGGSSSVMPESFPFTVAADVSDDDRFSGGRLGALQSGEVGDLIASVLP